MNPSTLIKLCTAAATAATLSLAVAIPAASAATPTSPQAAAKAAGVSGAFFNRETYNYSTALSTAQEGNRYQVMVMQSTDSSKLAGLRAANPNLKILMYQDVLIANPADPTGLTTCTTYPSDNASHPTWFLKDQTGKRIIDQNYAGDYLMDVGNPAYQQACAAHASTLAKQLGFDGIFMDDVTAWVGWDLARGVKSAQYTTMPSWQAAMYSMVSSFGPQMHTQGLLAVGNIGGSTATSGLWTKWNAPLDGAEEESWSDGGLGTAQQAPFMATKMANVASSEATGKYVILHSHNGSETGNTAGLATMLLVAQGGSSYATSTTNTITAETWYPEYSTAQALGAPTGNYTKLPNGVYQRAFANGIVLVNLTTTTIPSFSLGGGIYTGSQLSNVRSVSLAPTGGLILLRVG